MHSEFELHYSHVLVGVVNQSECARDLQCNLESLVEKENIEDMHQFL